MADLTSKNFGLMIAYVIPGLIVLWGISFFSPELRELLLAVSPDSPTIGGFLYITLAAVAAGVTVSAVRWALLDTLHHLTGLPAPAWDFSELPQKLPAFEAVAEDHYRYYQFYANSCVATALTYLCWRWSPEIAVDFPSRIDVAIVFLEIIFLAGSRDTLNKYYCRVAQLLGSSSPHSQEPPMTNGKHPTKPTPANPPKTESGQSANAQK